MRYTNRLFDSNKIPIAIKTMELPTIYDSNFYMLFDLVVSIFKWDFEMPKDKSGLLSNEIEKILMLTGICTIADVGKKDIDLVAFFTSESENGKYYDTFQKRTVTSPKISKTLNDTNSVLVWNNNTKSDCFLMVQKYAEQLTHIDMSIRNIAVNMREPLNIPTASTSKMFETLKNYRNQIFNGKYNPVQDGGLVQSQFIKGEKYDANTLPLLVESRKKILLDFYQTFGIRTGIEKKGNVIEDEIISSEPMLTINIDDMLEHRKNACEKIYDMFGIKCDVERSVNNAYSPQ